MVRGIDAGKFEKIEIQSAQELRSWLSDNHTQNESVWLVTYKAAIADKYVSRDAVLDELLAFGWTDGVRRKLSADKTMQLISKRRVQHWAGSYKERAHRLIEEGRMTPAGFQSIETAKASGLWSLYG